MEKIVYVLSAVLVPFSVRFFFHWLENKNVKISKRHTDDKFVVSIPKMVMHLGFVIVAITLIMLFAFTLTAKEPLHWLFFLFMGLFLTYGMYLVIITLTFRVIVNGKAITASTPFKRTFSFSFGEIVSATRKVMNTSVKSESITVRTANGKKLVVESQEIAYERFMKKLMNELPDERLTGF